MQLKTKRIIAREGLVAIVITILSILSGANAYTFFWKTIAPQFENISLVISVYPQHTIGGAILTSFKTLYIIYLSIWVIIFIIRFIVWAIKTLRKK